MTSTPAPASGASADAVTERTGSAPLVAADAATRDQAPVPGGARGPLTVVANRWDLLPPPERAPRVSIVICHYEQADELGRVLAGVALQRGPVEIVDVTVVDDGSGRPPVLPASFPFDLALLCQEDLGIRPAAARNLGATRAQGDVLVFLDGDTVPSPEYAAVAAAVPAVAPEAVVVGRRHHVDLAGWSPAATARWLEDPTAGRCPPTFGDPGWLHDGYDRTADLVHADDRSYQLVIGAVMTMARPIFDELGGFDAEIDCYGGEDWDLAYRAWNAGGLLVHRRDAHAFHDGPDWRGREGDQATKNPERRVVRRAVPGRDALAGPHPRVVVHLDAAGTDDDVVLASIETALAAGGSQLAVVVHHMSELVLAETRWDARVTTSRDQLDETRSVARLVASRPVMFCEGAVDAIVDALVNRAGGGRVRVVDADGPLLVATTTRAMGRAKRWAHRHLDAEAAVDALFGVATVPGPAVGVSAAPGSVDLSEVFTR